MQLTVIRGPLYGGPFELGEGENVAGRAADCEVCLPSKRVSRHHCVFTVSDGRVIVRDLGSHNGIVDGASGRKVSTLVLSPGGRVQIGDYLLGLEIETTDAVLEDDDEEDEDDVFIATSEIEAPLEDVELEDLELSLDDTASAIRAASLQSGLRSTPSRERTHPGPAPTNGPWESAGARRSAPRPDALARSPRALSRGESTAPRIDARPRLAAAEDTAASALPLDDSTPRANPSLREEQRSAQQPHVWLRSRGAPVPEEQPTAPPTPRPRPAEIRIAPDPRATEPRPAEPRPAEPRAAEPRSQEPRTGEPRAQDRTSRPTITEVSRPARPAPARPLEAPPMPLPERLPRSVPRSAPAPVAEAQPTGVPWLLQALLLISVCMSILVCSPVGGLIGQVSSQITIAHSAALLQGESVALALAARNADALASGADARLDMSLVAGTPGVRDARVTDARGMVLAPADKARLDMSHYAAFARAMGSGDAASAPTATGTTEIVVPVHTTASGPIVGYAWIEYDDDPVAASLVNPWIGAFASLLVAGTVGGLLVVGIWWLAMRPAQRLALSAERLASGRTDRVRSPARLDTWEQLARSLNELGARARQRGED